MNHLVPFLSKSTLNMTARRSGSIFLLALTILVLQPAPVVAHPISVNFYSGQLQIDLGARDKNEAIVITGDPNQLEVRGSDFHPTSYWPVTSLTITFERSEQVVKLEGGVPFSASLTSPILVSGGGLLNQVGHLNERWQHVRLLRFHWQRGHPDQHRCYPGDTHCPKKREHGAQ